MDSLLHGKEYELLGDIEVRRDDWREIRKIGLFRLVLRSCSASFAGRLGAALLFVTSLACFEIGHLSPSAWMAFAFGIWGIGVSAMYAVRAWVRLEQRFPPGIVK